MGFDVLFFLWVLAAGVINAAYVEGPESKACGAPSFLLSFEEPLAYQESITTITTGPANKKIRDISVVESNDVIRGKGLSSTGSGGNLGDLFRKECHER